MSCMWTDLEKQLVFLTNRDAGAQREMFAFQLLGPPLADYVLVGGQVAMIGPQPSV
jgi:hypothetical protein